MTQVRRDFAFTAALLIFGGCGAHSFVVDEYADDTPSSAAAPVDRSSATPAPTNTPSPIPPRVTSPPSESLDFTSQVFDRPRFPLFEPADAADLVSLFLDYLILDLVSPAGRGGLADDYTYLERLCLEGDEPDFVCRQRYGP